MSSPNPSATIIEDRLMFFAPQVRAAVDRAKREGFDVQQETSESLVDLRETMMKLEEQASRAGDDRLIRWVRRELELLHNAMGMPAGHGRHRSAD